MNLIYSGIYSHSSLGWCYSSPKNNTHLSFSQRNIFYPSFLLFLILTFFQFPILRISLKTAFLSCCLSVALWQRSLSPFPSNWAAPISPCLLDNWTCNPSPCIPITAAPSAFHTLLILAWVSLWTRLWPPDQKEYTILHCPKKLRSSGCFHLTHNTKYQHGMDLYIQYNTSSISFPYLNPWRHRAASPSAIHAEQGNSFWGSPAGIIHKGFNIKISPPALALNNSCLAFVFIGIGRRGAIHLYKESWFY